MEELPGAGYVVVGTVEGQSGAGDVEVSTIGGRS